MPFASDKPIPKFEPVQTAPFGARADEVAEYKRRLGQLPSLIATIEMLSNEPPTEKWTALRDSLENVLYLAECSTYRMRMLLTTYIIDTKVRHPNQPDAANETTSEV